LANMSYKIPAPSQFKKLTVDHATTIKAHFKRARQERAQICLIAEGIRQAHIHKKGDKAVYSREFDEWYSKNKLDAVFGTKANFTKYAQVGLRVFSYIANDFDAPESKREELIDALPVSISALYETWIQIRSATS